MHEPVRLTTPGRRATPARPVLTGRALALGGMLVLLVVLLASPIHRYLASRSDLGAASQQLRDDQRQLAELDRERAQWSDPGYIQQQARKRLELAMPGDTVYVVVDKGQSSKIEQTRGSGHAKAASGPAWNSKLWGSVRAADG